MHKIIICYSLIFVHYLVFRDTARFIYLQKSDPECGVLRCTAMYCDVLRCTELVEVSLSKCVTDNNP